MYNPGDKIELARDARFEWGMVFKGVGGTFIEYVYGFTYEGEFYEYSTPSCRVRLEHIEETCIVEDYEIKKIQG